MIKPFHMTRERMSELLKVARGDAPADLLLSGGKLVNVLSREVYTAEVAISGDRIAGVSTTPRKYQARQVIDLQGEHIAPGFIDAHVHIESSLLLPAEFANAVLPHGTTSVVSDPHEIANVYGIEGIRFMLEASEGLALTVFVMLSSCVPATDMETSGALLTPDDLASLVAMPRVLGIAEMMNYPGVINGADDMMRKALLGHDARLRLDGHSPGVTGLPLQAYIAAGVSSDHECVQAEEAIEKLRSGMQILIREGSTARNLDGLLPIVNERTARFCSFATDDKQPDDLVREGHLDHSIRRAIRAGLDPLLALQMTSLNTARHYGLDDMGAIAPGYRADLVTFPDLGEPHITRTFASGRLVAENGRMVIPQASSVRSPGGGMDTGPLDESLFAIPAGGNGRVRVIGAIPHQIVTHSLLERAPRRDGYVVADSERGIAKIAVIERHRGTRNVGLGLVKGFGLREGALASSIAHDSHNIVVVGLSDAEMLLAACTVAEMGGGISAVRGSEVLGRLPLPVAGLMSDQPLETVRQGMSSLLAAARSLGSPLDNPYMAMAFLALPVIPELKITDMGLVDVTRFQVTPLFTGD